MLRSARKGELIEFSTPDKLILHGFLMRPARKSSACIVYVHGMGGNFYKSRLYMDIAGAAAKKGFASFVINTRGHDSVSKVYGPRKKLMLGTNLERFEDCVADITGALRALRMLGFRTFVLVGHSTGCQKIAYYQYTKKDPSVRALVLLAPADDYAVWKKRLGKKFGAVVRLCKTLVRRRKGDETRKEIPRGFSAQRFLSVADPGRVETRLFDYEGPLKEFSSITTPMFAAFGSKEEYAVKQVKTYLDLLEKRTTSKRFTKRIVKNADHGFWKHEHEVADAVVDWLQKT